MPLISFTTESVCSSSLRTMRELCVCVCVCCQHGNNESLTVNKSTLLNLQTQYFTLRKQPALHSNFIQILLISHIMNFLKDFFPTQVSKDTEYVWPRSSTMPYVNEELMNFIQLYTLRY